MKRIITRPDFDGVVCAVLLKNALGGHLPIAWAQPNDIQTGRIATGENDIVANLPFKPDCALWFDHHVSNETDQTFKGLFRIAPSAAGLIYTYFERRIDTGFGELVRQADKIDSADLELEEILHPEDFPYILVSMTINTDEADHSDYCDHLVKLLGTQSIAHVITEPTVKRKCEQVVAQNKAYEQHLKQFTRMQGNVAITDFRNLDPTPNGNRFLVYCLFPNAMVNMKLFMEGSQTVVKLGHSIINRRCQVNVGQLLAAYGGGGHRGAGACRLAPEASERAISEILNVLVRNQN